MAIQDYTAQYLLTIPAANVYAGANGSPFVAIISLNNSKLKCGHLIQDKLAARDVVFYNPVTYEVMDYTVVTWYYVSPTDWEYAAYVRIPAISSSLPNEIGVAIGMSNASDLSNPAGTIRVSDGFAAVYPLRMDYRCVADIAYDLCVTTASSNDSRGDYSFYRNSYHVGAPTSKGDPDNYGMRFEEIRLISRAAVARSAVCSFSMGRAVSISDYHTYGAVYCFGHPYRPVSWGYSPICFTAGRGVINGSYTDGSYAYVLTSDADLKLGRTGVYYGGPVVHTNLMYTGLNGTGALKLSRVGNGYNTVSTGSFAAPPPLRLASGGVHNVYGIVVRDYWLRYNVSNVALLQTESRNREAGSGFYTIVPASRRAPVVSLGQLYADRGAENRITIFADPLCTQTGVLLTYSLRTSFEVAHGPSFGLGPIIVLVDNAGVRKRPSNVTVRAGTGGFGCVTRLRGGYIDRTLDASKRILATAIRYQCTQVGLCGVGNQAAIPVSVVADTLYRSSGISFEKTSLVLNAAIVQPNLVAGCLLSARFAVHARHTAVLCTRIQDSTE